MSDKKRRRITTAAQEGTTVELVETIQKPTEEVKEVKEETQDPHAQFYDESGEFLWDAYEATCVTRTRKPNPHIKTKNGDKVYSREPYAQELYDILSLLDRQNWSGRVFLRVMFFNVPSVLESRSVFPLNDLMPPAKVRTTLLIV